MDEKNKLMMGREGVVSADLQEAGDAVDDERFVVKLAKPYEFEHKVYTEIDLSGMEELTGTDMIAINKVMQRNAGGMGVMPEVSIEYACYFAARAAKLPVEFFFQLPPNVLLKVKNKVMVFFIRIGLSPADVGKLRRVAAQMSIVAHMDMFRLLDMSMPDFLDTVREVTEVVSRRKRV